MASLVDCKKLAEEGAPGRDRDILPSREGLKIGGKDN
jgi:hypothetical protein